METKRNRAYLEVIMSSLNQINFNDVLLLDGDMQNYTFNEYIKSGHHSIRGFCTRCEEKGCNVCPTDSEYKLQNISHGATSLDVLRSTGIDVVPEDWYKESVLFLMEGPGTSWDFYEEIEYNSICKKPTSEWYWIHTKHEAYHFPQEFAGARYGTLFNSIIHTFKLGNAYMTNLVKCGLNNDTKGYKGIAEYDWRCLETCVENVLMKEIEQITPQIVFIFGSTVEEYLWDLTYPGQGYPFKTVVLPHPARARSGFKNEYYRHLYFTRVLEGLYKANIYSLDDATVKFREFLKLSNAAKC